MQSGPSRKIRSVLKGGQMKATEQLTERIYHFVAMCTRITLTIMKFIGGKDEL